MVVERTFTPHGVEVNTKLIRSNQLYYTNPNL